MTTVTQTGASPSLSGAHVSWFGVLRSEWTKLWSVRSTYIILVLAAFFMIGLSFLIAYGISEAVGDNDFEGPASQLADTTWLSLQGIGLAQLAIGVLGVLVVSGEYSTGMIRATFGAVPRRIPVLIAKAILIVVATLIVMIPAAFAAFLLAQGMLASQNLDAQLSDPGVIRAVIGAALYLAAVGVIGTVLGWLLRSAAGAIFALVAVLILLPVLLPLIQLDWVQTFADYLPSTAGQEIYSVGNEAVTLRDIIDPNQPDLGPWTGYAIMVGWAVVGLVAAGWMLLRRDA